MNATTTDHAAASDSRPAVDRRGEWAGLAAILALAAGLRIWRLDQNGYGNPYYGAAVRSMLASGSNFFFGSFDPVGIVTVDKPPVALWIQAAGAKLLGYGSYGLLLPQALMGVASVALTYHLVRRVFGAGAGLLAGLALAITPICVAVDRDNLPDTALVLALLLAAWALSRAAETGRLGPLLLAMALVGVGFNIKMLAAFVVLPTFVLAYWPGRPDLGGGRGSSTWRSRAAVLAATSLSWSIAVELTPEGPAAVHRRLAEQLGAGTGPRLQRPGPDHGHGRVRASGHGPRGPSRRPAPVRGRPRRADPAEAEPAAKTARRGAG